MNSILPICKQPGCAEPVYSKGRKESLCKIHFTQDRDRKERINTVLVEKYLVRQFSKEEIAELVNQPLAWVDLKIREIRNENALWVQASGQDRLQLVVNDLLRNSKDRQNELWVSVANNDKDRVRALKALKDEDEYQVSLMQTLGYLPKTADQLVVHSSVESLVLNMDRNDMRGTSEIIDVEAEEIPVRELGISMELLYNAAVRDEDIEAYRTASRRATETVQAGPEEILRESFVDQLKDYGTHLASTLARSTANLQRDSEEKKSKETDPPFNTKSPAGWSLDPDGGLPVH